MPCEWVDDGKAAKAGGGRGRADNRSWRDQNAGGAGSPPPYPPGGTPGPRPRGRGCATGGPRGGRRRGGGGWARIVLSAATTDTTFPQTPTPLEVGAQVAQPRGVEGPGEPVRFVVVEASVERIVWPSRRRGFVARFGGCADRGAASNDRAKEPVAAGKVNAVCKDSIGGAGAGSTAGSSGSEEDAAAAAAAEAEIRARRVLATDNRFGPVAVLLFGDADVRCASLALDALLISPSRAGPVEHAVRDVLAWRCQAACFAPASREQFMAVATNAGVLGGSDMANLIHSYKKAVRPFFPMGWLSANEAANARPPPPLIPFARASGASIVLVESDARSQLQRSGRTLRPLRVGWRAPGEAKWWRRRVGSRARARATCRYRAGARRKRVI